MSSQPFSDRSSRGRSRTCPSWLALVLVLLSAIPALQPLWQPGLQQTDDGMHHLFRLFNLDLAVRAGHAGVRWLADEGFGYGFPVLNFYAPLTYYVGLLVHWLGAGFVTSLEAILAAGLILSALAMYLFARDLLGHWGGALAAIAYLWAPYHLADAWTRGALAELWAFIWFPLLLLAMRRAASPGREGLSPKSRPSSFVSDPWPVAWGAIALAGLILTHNLSLLLAAPMLAAWGAFVLLAEVRERSARLAGLRAYALMAGLGLMLSAAFWLPAIAESNDVWAGRVSLDFDQWAQALTPAHNLVSGTWAQDYTFSQGHPLGLAQGIVAGLGLAIGVWRWRSLRSSGPKAQGKRTPAPGSRAALALPLWLGLALLTLFLQTPWSRGVWRSVPGLLLLQFPWRWQAITALSLALITGYGAFALGVPDEGGARQNDENASTSRGLRSPELVRAISGVGAADRVSARSDDFSRPVQPEATKVATTKPHVFRAVGGVVLLILVAAALMSSALPGLDWSPAAYPTSEEMVSDANVSHRTMALYDYGRGLWLREHGNVWMFEYMPAWVQVPRSEFFLAAEPGLSTEPALAVQVKPGRQAPLERRFTVAAAQPWTMQLHQFYFPGWQAAVDGSLVAANPTGPLGLVGVSIPAGQHEVVFRFGPTPVRLVGWALSIAGLGLLVAGMVWLGVVRRCARCRRSARCRWLVGICVVAVVFVLLAVYQRTTHPSDFTPAPVAADFGDEVQLVGYHAPTTLGPGRDEPVLLEWLALRQPVTDYKVFVHLVDREGKLWAQHDGQPGFWFAPTTRWQRGELIEDRHVLEWQGGATSRTISAVRRALRPGHRRPAASPRPYRHAGRRPGAAG